MRALLNALGLTLWGLIAITLAVALATFGYRASLSYREWRGRGFLSSPSAAAATAPNASGSLAATTATAINPSAINPTTLKDQAIGRVLAKEDMIAAQEGSNNLGEQSVDAGTTNVDRLIGIARTYYRRKDCQDAVIWSDKAIAAARKARETPKESVYLFKLQCASDAGDTAGMTSVLVDLIRQTNKTSYWNDLLRIARQDEREDRNTLMLYRIMYSTNAMTEGSDYIEMAQLLSDAALPGEAFAVLDKAMSGGLIKNEQKERTARLLDALKIRAEADKEGLSKKESEAAKSASGESGAKLGEIYYGFADNQRAVEAINQGLEKGQIKHLDEAYVYLGLASLRLQNRVDAKRAFANLKAVPNISPRVLKLWELYSDTLDMGG
jgi:tetratricopeptide (TPR) repeat protein